MGSARSEQRPSNEGGCTGRGWRKGQSGNPGGRPKVTADVKELARRYTRQALDTLVTIMKDRKAPHSARALAANSLLDRGYGKPAQAIELPPAATVPRLTDLTEEELIERLLAKRAARAKDVTAPELPTNGVKLEPPQPSGEPKVQHCLTPTRGPR